MHIGQKVKLFDVLLINETNETRPKNVFFSGSTKSFSHLQEYPFFPASTEIFFKAISNEIVVFENMYI